MTPRAVVLCAVLVGIVLGVATRSWAVVDQHGGTDRIGLRDVEESDGAVHPLQAYTAETERCAPIALATWLTGIGAALATAAAVLLARKQRLRGALRFALALVLLAAAACALAYVSKLAGYEYSLGWSAIAFLASTFGGVAAIAIPALRAPTSR